MVSAIIVAGGKGSRMQDDRRKQYLPLGDYPVMGHTLLAFDKCHAIHNIVLVVPQKDFDFCNTHILPSLSLTLSVCLTPGGSERQESVSNGLAAVADAGLAGEAQIVLIHDAVRPFIDTARIIACIDGAKEYGACMLGIPAFDTLKKVDPSGFISDTLPREDVWLAQTPQAFQYDIIKKAHDEAGRQGHTGTDDASLVERIGEKVKMIRGSRYNIKITTPEDMLLAKAIFQMGKK